MSVYPIGQSVKIPTNGIRLHVRISGSGPGLLLIHGWMGMSISWRKVVEKLSERFTVIVPDMRGYGESDKPASGYDGLTLVDDLLGLCDALGLQKVAIIGHDMGAIPALLFAATHPDRTDFMGYVDEPLPGYNLDRFTAFSEENPFVYWWFGLNSQPNLAAFMWQGKEAELFDYFVTAMTADPGSVEQAAKEEYVRALRKPGGLEGSFGWYREVLQSGIQIREATQTPISVPVLGVNGQYGHPGVGDQLELVATNVEKAVIQNCGHLVAEEQPDAFVDVVLRWVDSI